MKIFIFAVLLTARVIAQTNWPFVSVGAVVSDIRLGEVGDASVRLGYKVGVERQDTVDPRSGFVLQSRYRYGVFQYLGLHYQQGCWLREDATRTANILFRDNVLIDSRTPKADIDYLEVIESDLSPPLSGLVWYQDVIQGRPERPEVFAFPATAPGYTNIIFAFKLFDNRNSGLVYFGWVELLRETVDSMSQFRFGRYAVDYLPNRGIRAGREPERPALVSEVTPESTTLSWDSLYAAHGFVLERTESLTPPVVWEPVETPPGATNIVIPNTPYSSSLFRLARP